VTSQADPDPAAAPGALTPVPGSTSSDAVMKLVQDQLAEERSTKTSLEARAIGVVTSSGALVTLLFALAALVTTPTGYELPDPARVALFATLVAFIGAAVLGIIASRPEAYQEVTVDSLRAAATPSQMGAPAAAGEAEIASVLVEIIATSRTENGKKAQHLRQAVTLEAFAAVLLAVAVTIILVQG
jgi:hypothetical protein